MPSINAFRGRGVQHSLIRILVKQAEKMKIYNAFLLPEHLKKIFYSKLKVLRSVFGVKFIEC
jgi:N-acetylglutamate synthase-like GNAT family acetyltransferase